MTYEQVAELFGRFNKASTWPTKNPRVFLFHHDGGEEYTIGLYEDDGKHRYLRVPFEEVRDTLNRLAKLTRRTFIIG